VGAHAGLFKLCDRLVDLLVRLVRLLGREGSDPSSDLALAKVQDDDVRTGELCKIPRYLDGTIRCLGVINGDKQCLVHSSPSPPKSQGRRSSTTMPSGGAASQDAAGHQPARLFEPGTQSVPASGTLAIAAA
jgi:hypothetical protein